MEIFNPNDENAIERMRNMFSPGQVDQQFRQAIQACWMMLPKDNRTTAELDRQVRRLVDRALRDLKEDVEAFSTER